MVHCRQQMSPLVHFPGRFSARGQAKSWISLILLFDELRGSNGHGLCNSTLIKGASTVPTRQQKTGGTIMQIADEPYPSDIGPLRGLRSLRQHNETQASGFELAQSPETRTRVHSSGYEEPTLLSLIEAVSEVTDDDQEVIATVAHMIGSGRVRFHGHFQDTSPTSFVSS